MTQPETQPEPRGDALPVEPPEAPVIRLSLPGGQARVVWAILAINIALYALPALGDLLGLRIDGLPPSVALRAWGAKDNAAVYEHGEWYRLFTAMFLHGGLIHLLFNSWALYAIGIDAERLFGTAAFLALYLISGLAGSVASYALTPNPSVGASGAIFGLVGGLSAFFYASRHVLGDLARRQLGNLITVIMINLFIGFGSPLLIDNMAHLGGLVGGAAVGWLLAPRIVLDHRLYPPELVARRLPWGWAGALGVLLLLVLAAFLIAPPIR
jgi:rhomboid protease GluP